MITLGGVIAAVLTTVLVGGLVIAVPTWITGRLFVKELSVRPMVIIGAVWGAGIMLAFVVCDPGPSGGPDHPSPSSPLPPGPIPEWLQFAMILVVFALIGAVIGACTGTVVGYLRRRRALLRRGTHSLEAQGSAEQGRCT